MKEVILLGTDFLFTEELGSRLRSIGHTVYPFESINDLDSRVADENLRIKLVILDMGKESLGGSQTISKVVTEGIKVIAIGAHKNEKALEEAKSAGASIVIANSQASRSIEEYVAKVLTS